jgi:hypothetical protein
MRLARWLYRSSTRRVLVCGVSGCVVDRPSRCLGSSPLPLHSSVASRSVSARDVVLRLDTFRLVFNYFMLAALPIGHAVRSGGARSHSWCCVVLEMDWWWDRIVDLSNSLFCSSRRTQDAKFNTCGQSWPDLTGTQP